MKNKGITLIEMLVVIAILGIIMMITIPLVGQMISSSEEEIYKRSLKHVEEAARMYAYRNVILMPSEPGERMEINIETLIEEGYLEVVKDPRNSSVICSGLVTIVVDSNRKFNYFPILNCGETYSSDFQNYGIKNITHSSVAGGYKIVVELKDRTTLNNISLEGNQVNIFSPNILNYDSWTNLVGETIAPGFSRYGSVDETIITLKENPWGNIDVVWAVLENDPVTGADGGFISTNFPVDNAQTYRYTVWIRRENVGVGSGPCYFGLNGFSGVSNTGVLPRTGGTANTNPYFWVQAYNTSHSIAMTNNWILLVAHVHPFGYSGNIHQESGLYNTEGTKLFTMSTEYQWNSTTTAARHRVLLVNSTKIDERVYWYRPRVDVVDENMIPLSTLIKGHEHPTLYGNEVAFNVTSPGVHYIELVDASGKTVLYPYWIQ